MPVSLRRFQVVSADGSRMFGFVNDREQATLLAVGAVVVNKLDKVLIVDARLPEGALPFAMSIAWKDGKLVQGAESAPVVAVAAPVDKKRKKG